MGENKKRAVRKNRLTDDEARLFRANYEFMWRTLGTTPYAVQPNKKTAYKMCIRDRLPAVRKEE